MILFGFRETPRGEHNSPDILGHRWAIEADRWSLGLVHQVRTLNGWLPGAHYFAVTMTDHWDLGAEHVYYDGPHCSFSIGPVHFCWSYWWCKKCHGDA